MDNSVTVRLNVREVMEAAAKLEAKAGKTILSLILARVELEAAPDDSGRAFWEAVINCLVADYGSERWNHWKEQEWMDWPIKASEPNVVPYRRVQV